MKKIEHNELSTETKKSMRTRIITAIVLALICVPCIIIGKWAFFALSIVVSVFAGYELVNVIGLKGKSRPLVYATSIILMIGSIYWIYFSRFFKNIDMIYTFEDFEAVFFDATDETGVFYDIMLSSVAILIGAGVYFTLCIFNEDFTVVRASYLLSMNVIVSLCIQSLLYLRFMPATELFTNSTHSSDGAFVSYFWSALLIIFVILGTIANDIGAYFVGLLFGKHKMNQRVSPKKTWEGFVGGYVFSFAISFGFAMICASVGLPLVPILDVEHWYWIFIISLVLPLIATLGDFSFSTIKRNYGIKDFSNILPGHGGVLDRIDSLLFVSAFVAIILIFINRNWIIFR
ncbi:MAG: phosphatidate cytidylyltransferase [Bacilli bacterium]|nr:phosphatidate cytidylyltransferase [Bacilli bacterium]